MMTLLAFAALALAGPAEGPTIDGLIAAHNKERAERKLPPLVAEPRLTAAAKAQAQDMAKHRKMSHQGSDGSSPSDRVKRAGYTYQKTGENVAEGQETVAAVMTSWMESPHHRENILGDFTEVGVAVAEAEDGTPYWCVDFGRPFPKLDPSKAEEDLAVRLNHARADASPKLKNLRVDPKLAAAARAIAADTAAGRDAPRDAPKPTDPVERIKASGYRYRKLSEAGAFGTPSPEETLNTLLNSPEQKAVLLGKDFADLGVGYAVDADGRPSWIVIVAVPLE
jgi:uncharacterized protein YkwD